MADGMTVRALLLKGAANAGVTDKTATRSANSNFFIASILPNS